MKRRKLLEVLWLAIVLSFGMGQVRAQTKEARKFDELPLGIGNVREQENEMNARLERYARQLRIERARAFIIGYSPRIVEYEVYNRSYGDMRAGQAKSILSQFFDWRRITTIDGGFREIATTELWIVPLGAEPPKPKPNIQPDEVVHCPFLRVQGSRVSPDATSPIEFKAL